MEANDIISSGLLELYVLGMTNEQETAQVRTLLEQQPGLAAEIAAIERSLEHYARVHAVNPPVKLKERVFDTINGDQQPAAAPRKVTAKVVTAPFWKWIAAASVILLFGSIAVTLHYHGKYQQASTELQAANEEKIRMQQQLEAQALANDQMKNDWNVVQSKYSEPHMLMGMPTAPDAVAKIFWMKNNGDVYIDASNLPDAPQGMQYQFWGIVDGKPVDGGLIFINSREDKYRIKKMKSFGKAEAFAITLETMGGHPQPKGDMYVMGKM